MNTAIFEVLPELTIDGVWIGLGVFLVVQAFKYAGLVAAIPGKTPDEKVTRLALLAGLFFGAMWVFIELNQAGQAINAVTVVAVIYRALTGALVAALFYNFILKPVMGKLGIGEEYYGYRGEDAHG